MTSFAGRSALDREGESGFTVLELLIVMGLLSVVMTLVGASLISMTQTTRSTEERSFADTELRNAVEQMSRDIRAANPIDEQTCVAATHVPSLVPSCSTDVIIYDRQISFEVYCTEGAGCIDNLRQVVYRVTSNRLEVSRGGAAFEVLLGPSTTSGLPITQRQFAIINSATEPVFTYLKSDRTALATQGGTPASGERFRDCTRAVRIHLKMITEPGNVRAPADLTTTVALRNFNEVTGCENT